MERGVRGGGHSWEGEIKALEVAMSARATRQTETRLLSCGMPVARPAGLARETAWGGMGALPGQRCVPHCNR